MRRHHPSRRHGPNRPGTTLVMFALLLPLLLGMVGLAIDGGLLLATYRQTQNAADAAATAAAMDLINNQTIATAQATGKTYVQTYNNMAGATVTINIPPLSGPHAGAGNTTYAEALVSYPYKTSFIQLLGVNQTQTVGARAVAGNHLSAPAEGVMTLEQNPGGGNGLTVSGGATLKVDGPIVDNATDSHQALNVSGGSTVSATKVSVSGGSNASASAIQNYSNPPGGDLTPLTNTGVNYANPLANLAVPTTANGVVNTNYGNVTATNGQTLSPGIYTSITVPGGISVAFNPGIYVLAGGSGGNALTVSGSSTVTGSGVMFYNTASTYSASTGVDGSGGSYGKITISGGSAFNLSGLSNSGSPYNSMLVFQDTSNPQTLTVSGGSTSKFAGTWYAPDANVTISGGSTYDSQFTVGSMTISGGSSTVSITPPASQSNLVYLVE